MFGSGLALLTFGRNTHTLNTKPLNRSFILSASESPVRRDGVRCFPESGDVFLHGWYQKIIIRWIPLVQFIARDQTILIFVDPQFVAEFHGFRQLAFFDRASFRIEEADHPIGNDPIAGDHFLGLGDQLACQIYRIAQLRLECLSGRLAFFAYVFRHFLGLIADALRDVGRSLGNGIDFVPSLPSSTAKQLGDGQNFFLTSACGLETLEPLEKRLYESG